MHPLSLAKGNYNIVNYYIVKLLDLNIAHYNSCYSEYCPIFLKPYNKHFIKITNK